MNRVYKLLLSILVIGTLGFPIVASAANHKFTCAEMAFTEGSPTCSNGIWTFTGSDQEVMDSASSVTPNTTPVFPLTNSTTYFVNVTALSSGSGKYIIQAYRLGTGFLNATPITSPTLAGSFSYTGSTGGSLSVGHSSGTTPEYNGDLGPICISSVSAADALALCAPTPAVTAPGYQVIWW